MRRLRYQVACSLDGYIASATGDYDWIVMDPEIDFGALFAEYDTLLMGRRTYEGMGGGSSTHRIYVASTTLQQEDHPKVTIVRANLRETVEQLKSEQGKDIWLYGGGALFRTLLEMDLVDTVEPAVIPVLLGGGVPLLPSPAARKQLVLEDHRLYAKSGIMLLKYRVEKTGSDVKPKRASKSRRA